MKIVEINERSQQCIKSVANHTELIQKEQNGNSIDNQMKKREETDMNDPKKETTYKKHKKLINQLQQPII